jgi:DNA primase
LDFIRDRIVEQYDLARIDQQIACANQILPTIVKIQDIVERTIQINRTADVLKVSDKALLQEFKKVVSIGKPQIAQPIPEKQTGIPPVERYLIKALLKDKSLIPQTRAALDPQELSHPVAQKVVRELFVYNDKSDFEARILDTFRGTEYQAYLANLFMQIDEVVDPATTVQDCLSRLRQKDFEHETLNSTRKLRDAQKRKDGKDVLDTMLEQKNKDLREKRKFVKKNEFPLEK